MRGAAEATGEWIGFVDGDDYIEPDMYEKLMANALQYGADISHCGFRMVFPSRVDYYYNTGRLQVQDQRQGCADLLEGSYIEPGLWNKLYRKPLFSGLADRMDMTIRINEDLLMNYYLFANANLSVYEDFCPYHYVLRPGSAATSRLNDHKLRDPLKVLHSIMAQIDENLQDVLLQRLARQLVAGSTMSLSHQPELVRPFRKETRRELRRRLGQILGSGCRASMKIMAIWAAVWPASYGWVHRTYSRLRGLDKKYEIK
jgi:glycosyltransferase involved in cell wall biosynthesis